MMDRETLATALWDRHWSHYLATVPPDFVYAPEPTRTRFLCDADALLPLIRAAEDEAFWQGYRDGRDLE